LLTQNGRETFEEKARRSGAKVTAECLMRSRSIAISSQDVDKKWQSMAISEFQSITDQFGRRDGHARAGSIP